MESTIVIPKPGEIRPYRQLYERWREAPDLASPIPPAQNIRFAHDPLWRERIFSVQNAHDRRSPVWRVVEALMIVAGMMGGGTGFVRWH